MLTAAVVVLSHDGWMDGWMADLLFLVGVGVGGAANLAGRNDSEVAMSTWHDFFFLCSCLCLWVLSRHTLGDQRRNLAKSSKKY